MVTKFDQIGSLVSQFIQILRKDLHLRKIASKWVPHALTEVEKWTRYAICHLLFFPPKSTLFIHPRAPNTNHFHLYISMFLHDLSILPKKKISYHDLTPNPLTKTQTPVSRQAPYSPDMASCDFWLFPKRQLKGKLFQPFSLLWKSYESTKRYLTQMLLAINWRYSHV
jgi:hypothetical protein